MTSPAEVRNAMAGGFFSILTRRVAVLNSIRAGASATRTAADQVLASGTTAHDSCVEKFPSGATRMRMVVSASAVTRMRALPAESSTPLLSLVTLVIAGSGRHSARAGVNHTAQKRMARVNCVGKARFIINSTG